MKHRSACVVRLWLLAARCASAVLLIVIPVVAGRAAAQEGNPVSASPRFITQPPPAESPVDWIFLIDSSGSMTQRVDGSTILDRVKTTLAEFTTLLRPNDTVSAWVFDANSRRLSRRILATGSDLEQFARQIAELHALGQWTHTGAALADGLREAYERPVEPGPHDRAVAIVLLTDGREDVRGIPPADRVPVSDAIKLVRDDHVPYVFYVSLGTTPDPALLKFLDGINSRAAGRGTVIADQGGRGLRQSVKRIRDEMTKPEPLQIKPAELDLGRVLRGGSAGDGFIDILSPVAASVGVAGDAVPPGHTLAFDPPGPVAVGPGQWARVRIRLDVADDATEETTVYSVTVTPIDPPRELRPERRSVPIKVEVTHSPWGFLLLLALALLALGVAFYFLYQWLVLGVRPGETSLVALVSTSFKRDPHVRPLRAALEARNGAWRIPLEAGESVIDATTSPRLGDVVARARLRSMGNTHDLTVVDGPVRWRRAGEPFEDLPPDRTVMLGHRSEIELGGVDGRTTVLRYVGQRSDAAAPRALRSRR